MDSRIKETNQEIYNIYEVFFDNGQSINIIANSADNSEKIARSLMNRGDNIRTELIQTLGQLTRFKSQKK